MKEKRKMSNWAVEAVDPPPGVSSFSTINTQRDTRIQRRNPQFENEQPPPVPPPAPVANQSESGSTSPAPKGAQSPEKLEKSKDPKGNDKPGRRFSGDRKD